MNQTFLRHLVFCVITFFGVSQYSFAQFNIQESFTTSTTSAKVKIGDNAKLTATTGQTGGWLRLTPSSTNQKGYVYIDEQFPSERGILIDFEYKSWRESNKYDGADGISVFLFDAKYGGSSFKLGSYGGSLGYGPDGKNKNGLLGGYIGIGLDEYGNFVAGANGHPLGSFAQNIAVRGKIIDGVSTTAKYLTHRLVKEIGKVDYGISTTRPDDSKFYRRVQIELKPINVVDGVKVDKEGNPVLIKKYQIKVRWMVSKNGPFIDLLTYDYSELPFDYMKLGFAASTGAAVNNHEIRNLNVTTPDGVMVSKTVDKKSAVKNEDLTYTITISNHASEVYENIVLNDNLTSIKDFFQVNQISFSTNGNSKNKMIQSSDQPNITDAKTIHNWMVTLDKQSSITITVKGKVVGYPSLGVLTNEATIDLSRLHLPFVDYTKTKAKAETTITGKPWKATKITTDHTTICEGYSAKLTVNKVEGEAVSYRWFVDGVLYKIIDQEIDADQGDISNSIDVTNAGVYSVVYVVDGVSSEESNKLEIKVNPSPKIRLANPEASTSLIAKVGDPVTLPKIISDDANVKITWFDNMGKVLSTSANGSLIVSQNKPGTYTYSVVGEYAGTTCSTFETIVLTVFSEKDCPVNYRRVWADNYTWGSAITGGISNKSNAVDGKADTYSTITVGLGLLGLGTTWQNLYFAEEQPAGTPVTIKLGKEYSGLVALGGLTVVGLDKKGYTIGSLKGIDGGLVDLLSADNVLEYTFVPSDKNGPKKYLGVRVVLGSTLSIAQNAKVYGAHVSKPITQADLDQDPNLICKPVLPNINPNVADVLHGVEDLGLGVASATASVTNPWNAVDNDPDSYALITRGVSVLNSASLTVIFKQPAIPGDELHITLENKNLGVLSLELIKGFKIQRYLGDKKVGEALTESNGLLRLRLLGLGGRNRMRIIVSPATQPFDRVKISYGSVVGVLGDFTHIYNVELVPKVDVGLLPNTVESGIEVEQVLEMCDGESLTIKPIYGMCTTYDVFTDAKGNERLPIKGDLFSYDVTGYLPVGSTSTVYVQAIRNGCLIGSRTPLKIKINALPKIESISELNDKGNSSVIKDVNTIKGGKLVVLEPQVEGEIQSFEWTYLLADETQWKAFSFAEVEQPEVEIRQRVFEKDKDGNVVLDSNGFPIIKVEGGTFITKKGSGKISISLPKNAIVNGVNYHQNKSKIRLIVTSLSGCTDVIEFDAVWLKGYRDGIFSNPMLPNKTRNKQ